MLNKSKIGIHTRVEELMKKTKHHAMRKSFIFPLIVFGLILTNISYAQNDKTKTPPWERQVFFGEQHIHTGNSPDAFVLGGRATWGKEIKLSTTGKPIKKKTPYDFVGITDHSEYFAVMPLLIDPSSPLSKTDLAKKLKTFKGDPNSPESPISIILASITFSIPMPEYLSPEILTDNWSKFVATANKYNDPGNFTAFISYEWTAIPNGRNMHRNVYFRDDVGPKVPFSSFDSYFPEDLWTYQEIQRNMGHENLAIPHNGNVSDGWMFSPNEFLGGPMDVRYAERQAANEPVFEMIQTKGSSDTHPYLSPNDEFADFELFNNMINVGMPSQLKHSFYRQGLGEGMKLEKLLGTNPYKMGIVAGSDIHSGYSGNEEWGWNGAHGSLDDTPAKRLTPGMNPSGEPASVVGSAGTTAIWAEENTRASLFDGMKNKETYGTSGTMIRLRFFGGWEYEKDIIDDPEYVKMAYLTGVPMGGDLREKPNSAKAPTFIVQALKDPESGNLDRIQIIKVFVNKWDRADEKIYDVALSDGRKVDPKTGKAPDVGNTVNVKKATYTNDIGDSQLSAVWTDPDFDASQRASYYVRVLEIPTPRWTTYDAARNNLPLPTDVPAVIQERAWSSPIWYTPSLSKK